MATAALLLLPMAAIPLAGVAHAAPAEGSVRLADTPTAVPGRYVVRLLDTAALQEEGVATVAARLAARFGGTVLHTYRGAAGFAVRLDEGSARRLAADAAVEFVQSDQRIRVDATQRPTPSWGLDRIDQRNLPLNNSFTYPTTAANVHAYVVDTGIRIAHQTFGGRATNGYDFVNYDSVAEDCNGHGTHVAGTLGGSSYGVAKGAQLVALRVFDCSGNGYSSDVAAAVDWISFNAIRPAVANLSLGGGPDDYLDQSIRFSIGSGVTYVVAAGNDNAGACGYSPARVGEAITVGATTRTDARASFSNFGRCLDLFAPGDQINSAWYTSNTASAVLSGTSMAAPHVAGAAALYLATNTGASAAQVNDHLIATATAGKVTNPGSGSPNRLLYASGASAAHVLVQRMADHNGDGTADLTLARGYDYYLDLGSNGSSDQSFYTFDGSGADPTAVGDYDGNGTDDVAQRWPTTNTFRIDTGLDGFGDLFVNFGRTSDLFFTGDFNGDGITDLGLRRGTEYFLDLNLDGVSDQTVTWGRSTDGFFVGDFDGNGTTDLALRRETTYYIDLDRNGVSDRTITWGRGTDLHLVGDFDGNGVDDLGLRRDTTFYLDLTLDGRAENTVVFGRATDAHLTGDVNGDGADDLGLRRGNQYFFDVDRNGSSERTITFGRATDRLIGRVGS